MIQIIPAIDIRNGKCVRLRQGDYNAETIFGDDPVAMARRWAEAGAARIHLVDLDGAKAGNPINTAVIRAITGEVKVPCQLGGGFRDNESVHDAFSDLSVDRVVIGTAALKNPDWFRAAAQKYPHRLILGLDARSGRVATEGWLETSEIDVVELARQYDDLPLAAIVYTNIANDGMMQGIDDDTINDLQRLAEGSTPVIASGGVTSLEDIRKLTQAARNSPRLTGAIVGRTLYEGKLDLKEAIRVSQGDAA